MGRNSRDTAVMAFSFEFRFQWFCDDAGLMRMREHLETRVHIGEGGPCPLSIRGLFRHGKQTCGYHAIKSSRSMLKRCFRFELRQNAIGRFFSSFHFSVGRKFPIILSRISSFFVSAIDGSLGAGNLAKGNGEIFPREKRI